VLTTCNYEARKFGCRSALPVFKARELCPELVVLPVRFDLYREESRRVRAVFAEFTELVEPLSLDEAYLDVSALRSSGAAIAEEIRWRIVNETGLTASAGIAPNKLIAKIASDWEKPDGQFEVTPEEIDGFMRDLPVRKIWGVGSKTAEKLASVGAGTCGQLQQVSLAELTARFGKFGAALYELCRGIDRREVNPERERKSLSNETTFRQDLPDLEAGLRELRPLIDELGGDLRAKHGDRVVQSAFVKVKFSDFQQTTAERRSTEMSAEVYEELLEEAWSRGGGKAVRLIGTGVRFAPQPAPGEPVQMGLGI
jgi:DNA polymerase-4